MNGRSHRGNGTSPFTHAVRAIPTGVVHTRNVPHSRSAPATRSTTTRKADPERQRFAIAVVIMFLYLALLPFTFLISLSPVSLGVVAVRNAAGEWVVERVVPASPAYDAGVMSGDAVLSIDGATPSAYDSSGQALFDVTKARTLVYKNKQGAIIEAELPQSDGSPLRRWSYALLGLIFISVGGPVYIKARQRIAALAFYAFCVFSALALSLAIAIVTNQDWIFALMFVTLLLWAGSFAYFFFNFPVKVGRTPLRRTLILAILAFTCVAALAGYVWALLVNPSYYEVVRSVVYLYLIGCVVAGLVSLGRSLVAEKSREIRQQLLLLLGGTAIGVGPPVFLTIIPSLIINVPLVNMNIAAISLGIIPLAFAYAITQHQLLGVRHFVRRSVVYVIMGSGVLLVFSFSAAALGYAAPNGWEKEEWGLIGFGFFVFLIAFSYSHLQRRVETLVDRYIYHDAYDYKEALLQFSSQLASEQKLQVLADELVERTCRLMNLVCGVVLLASHPDTDSGPSTSRYRRSGLSLRGLDGEPDEAPTLTRFQRNGTSGSPSDGLIQLQGYAKYGECADDLIEGLQEELSRMGISLREVEGSILPLQIMYGDTARSSKESLPAMRGGSIVADDVRQVGSLADAVSGEGLSEVISATTISRENSSGELEMVRSFLGVPLWTRNRFVGVLCLAGKRTGERFTKDDLSLLSTLGSQAALAIYNAQLHEAREQALLDTIAALAHSIEAKDGYTIEHCEKMTGRAVAVAHALGLSRQEVENVRLGAILHDVGKIGIPDAVLNKPGKLTPEEYETIKEHAAIGARIVQSVGALQGVVPIVRHHQERYDGSGYPDGLAGEDIPLGARIIGVVDTYGAMTEDRVYRKAPGHARAIDELQRLAGKQFDPVVVAAFVKLIDEHPELAEVEYSYSA